MANLPLVLNASGETRRPGTRSGKELGVDPG